MGSGGEWLAVKGLGSGADRKDAGCSVAVLGNGRSSALEAIANCGVGRNSDVPVASVGVEK